MDISGNPECSVVVVFGLMPCEALRSFMRLFFPLERNGDFW